MIFFFKQKTAYEMRISDWSSDVCSSDLAQGDQIATRPLPFRDGLQDFQRSGQAPPFAHGDHVMSVPVERMQHEAAPRFDRTAAQDGSIRNVAGLDVEALQQIVQDDAVDLVAAGGSQERKSTSPNSRH